MEFQLFRKLYLNAGDQIRGRSTLAYQRRLVHRRVIGIPSEAEHQVVRGDVLERRRVDDAVGAVESPEITGQTVSHIEVAIGELHREVRADAVSDARVERPG